MSFIERHCERKRSNPVLSKHTKWIASSLLLLAMTSFVATVFAQGTSDFSERLKLAEQMVELRPVSKQVDNAIEQFIDRYTPNASLESRTVIRSKLLGAVNTKALEKTTIDSYAEVFTKAELEAMVEYHSKVEAKSAAKKYKDLNAKVSPKIVEMLDKALMQYRTQPEE